MNNSMVHNWTRPDILYSPVDACVVFSRKFLVNVNGFICKYNVAYYDVYPIDVADW